MTLTAAALSGAARRAGVHPVAGRCASPGLHDLSRDPMRSSAIPWPGTGPGCMLPLRGPSGVLLAVYGEDDLSVGMPAFQDAVSFSGLGRREHAADAASFCVC